MNTKICNKCSKELPLTEEYFWKRKDSKDGFRNTCRVCSKARGKQYYKENMKTISQQNKSYRENNKDKIANQRKIYTEKTKKQKAEYDRQYRKVNSEKIRIKRIENKDSIAKAKQEYWHKNNQHLMEKAREWQKNNKEYVSEKYQEYYKQNKEKILKKNRKWCQNNREKRRIIDQRRVAKKYKLLSNLTLKQWEQLKKYFNNKCAYCGAELPLTQDHFIPLSQEGECTVDNIIPACQRCNSSKKDNDFFKWYSRKPYYSKVREQKILKYLHYTKKEKLQQLSIC